MAEVRRQDGINGASARYRLYGLEALKAGAAKRIPW
jgi:hypothetical protein